MATTFQEDMIMALMQECYGKIGIAKMNINVMLKNPTGVGDHSNYVQSIKEQANIIAEAKGLLEVLEKDFYDKE
tara:strand:- start:529 stop:750 length:222 start_codon:yes stop_codon:yes gene_type:complete